MNIVNAKVNHVVNPIGYRMDRVVFSWIVEDVHDFDPFNADASKVLQKEYPKIYEYILWFRRMQLKVVLENHGEGNDELYQKLNNAFYKDAVTRLCEEMS